MTVISENKYGKIEYVAGDSVYDSVKTIKATCKPGYQFMYWDGNVAESDAECNPLKVNFNDGITYKKIDAVFKQDTSFALVAKAGVNGTCSISVDSFNPQTQVAAASPVTGYRFKEWQGDYITASNKYSNPVTITLNADMSTAEIEAVFEEDPAFTKITKSNNSISFISAKTLQAQLFGRFNPITSIDSAIVKIELGTIVEEISEACFANCVRLTSVSFRSDSKVPYKASLKVIGNKAFYNTRISSFDFLRAPAIIGPFAFAYTSFTNIDFNGSKITELQDSCFQGCLNLVSVTFPAGVFLIQPNVFADCNKLITVNSLHKNYVPVIRGNSFMPAGEVQGRIFNFYSSSESEIAIYNNGWYSFENEIRPVVNKDTVLRFAAQGKNSKKTVQLKLFRLSKDTAARIDWGDSSTSTVEFGSSITKNVKHKYTTDLTETVITISNTISQFTYNGTSAAAQRIQLVRIEQLGSKISTIQRRFICGSKIKDVIIPATVTHIEYGAFSDCAELSISGISSKNGTAIGKSWLVHNNTLVDVLCDNTATEFNATDITQLKYLQADSFKNHSALTAVSFPRLDSVVAPVFLEHVRE